MRVEKQSTVWQPNSMGMLDGLKLKFNDFIIDMTINYLSKDFRNRNLIKGKCQDCKFIKNCGGCRANAYIKYGDYLQGDDVCWK